MNESCNTQPGRSAGAGTQGAKKIMKRSLITAALLAAPVLAAAPARAEIAYAPQRHLDSSPQLAQPFNLARPATSIAEIQGLSCLGGGAAGSTISLVYANALVGVSAASAVPAVIPLVALSFAIGCSVGATAAPGLVWLYRLAR